MAPELLPYIVTKDDETGNPVLQSHEPSKVNEKVDVYSFGVLMWEIWTLGDRPFAEKDLGQLLYELINREIVLDMPDDCDSTWADLAKRCLQMDPESRPNFEEITQDLEKLLKT